MFRNVLRVGTYSELPSWNTGDNILAAFRFCSGPEGEEHPCQVNLALPPLGESQPFEIWKSDGEVVNFFHRRCRIMKGPDYGFVVLQIDESEHPDFEKLSRDAYLELLDGINASGFSAILKIWNYFDQINLGKGDSERYRLFSSGRADAFKKMQIADDALPTGTAIGSQGGNVLTLVALVSSYSLLRFENPRQVSAYRYPRKYGPREPKFSRAGFVSGKEHSMFLLSGTAAVIGHESAHPFDVESQTVETFNNLDLLVRTATHLSPGGQIPHLDRNSILRVYLRDRNDYRLVAKLFKETLNRDMRNVSFLHGDICRGELEIEIDGVRISSSGKEPRQ